MVSPAASAALRQFVDDELMRAPLLVDQVIDGALEHIHDGMPGMTPHDRAVAGELMSKAKSNRQFMVDYYVRTLRDQIADDANRPPPVAAGPSFKLSLSLVDEDEVAVDVEISHTIEAIRSGAEYELRELQTFTAALVGDMDVTRDHNPFRAETHGRALWSAAQALPLSRGYQLMFMRHASSALAQVLRKSYAGASSRLEAAGVEPAAHRTLILPAGSRRSNVAPENAFQPDLERIRDSMPVRSAPPAAPAPPLEQVLEQHAEELRALPPHAESAEFDRLRAQQRASLAESATTQVDQQLVELVSRLFDAILSDSSIAPDIRLLLSRLQAPALRVAMRDAKTLDKDVHPVWLFADRLAFFSEILPPPPSEVRDSVLRFLQDLVDHIVAEQEQSASLYHWAIERLQRHETQRLEQRCGAAAGEIQAMGALDLRLAASSSDPSTQSGALDLGQMDTVPAALISTEPERRKPPAAARQWLEERRAGDWVRLFMQGRWVYAQLLWPGDQGEVYLFGDGAGPTTWAVRRRALLTLWNENLLDSMLPQSLVRTAAKRVMRQSVRS